MQTISTELLFEILIVPVLFIVILIHIHEFYFNKAKSVFKEKYAEKYTLYFTETKIGSFGWLLYNGRTFNVANKNGLKFLKSKESDQFTDLDFQKFKRKFKLTSSIVIITTILWVLSSISILKFSNLI